MASRLMHKVVGLMLAGSLIGSSTVAVAATVQPVQQPNSWAVLAVMSGGAPAATICGAAATAAAAGAVSPTGCVLPVADAPPVPVAEAPPPPLPAAAVAGAGISPLILALIGLAAGVGVLLAINHNGTANSPA